VYLLLYKVILYPKYIVLYFRRGVVLLLKYVFPVSGGDVGRF